MSKDLQLRAEIERLERDRETIRGAMLAQDNREKAAGEKCGVSWMEHGCDWPDAVAETVLVLRAERDRFATMENQLKSRAFMERDEALQELQQVTAERDQLRDIVESINALQAGYGASLKILCDNEDGPPNNAILVNDCWTGWEDRRFEGNTLAECLAAALMARNDTESKGGA